MSKENKQEIVLNLENWGVPIAIVISAIILALVIFLASRNTNNKSSDSGSTDTNTSADSDIEGIGDVEVSIGNDPYIGNLDTATVAVIEFSDYQCGYCQRHSQQTFPSIKEEYVDTGKVVYVFKEFPLSSAGQMGHTIAKGGVCVYELGGNDAFASYHKDAFFAENNDVLISLAKDLGIDATEFSNCIDSSRHNDELSEDQKEGSAAGITGTPGFVVGLIGDNGKIIEPKLIAGAYPFDTFKSVIDALLK